METIEKIFNLLKEKALKEKGVEVAYNEKAITDGMTKYVYFFPNCIRHNFYIPYDENKYIKESNWKEKRKELIEAKLFKMSHQKKLYLIKKLYDKEYHTRRGWRPQLIKFFPYAVVPDIGDFWLDENFVLTAAYTTREHVHSPESDDGWRGEVNYTRTINKRESYDLKTDADTVNSILYLYFSSIMNDEKLLKAFGLKLIDAVSDKVSIELTDVEIVDVIGEEAYKEFIKDRVAEVYKFNTGKIKEYQEKINKINQFVSENKTLVRFIKNIENLPLYAVREGRNGEPVVFRRGEKIRLFDRKLAKLPEAGEEIYILDEVELDRVIIIKDWLSYNDYKKEKEKLYKLADEADAVNPLSPEREISYLEGEMKSYERILNYLKKYLRATQS